MYIVETDENYRIYEETSDATRVYMLYSLQNKNVTLYEVVNGLFKTIAEHKNA